MAFLKAPQMILIHSPNTEPMSSKTSGNANHPFPLNSKSLASLSDLKQPDPDKQDLGRIMRTRFGEWAVKYIDIDR